MGRQITANTSVRWAGALGTGSREGAEPGAGGHLNQVLAGKAEEGRRQDGGVNPAQRQFLGKAGCTDWKRL